MLASILVACLCSPAVGAGAAPQDPQPPERQLSEREVARRAAREIKQVLKGDSVEDILTMLREQGRIDDTDVVRAVGDGIGDERDEVTWAAIRTLRFNPCKKAVSELMSAARDKRVRASEEMMAEVFRGLGQHGDPRALSLLTDGFGPDKEADAITNARIDAVGRIQTPDAVNELIKFARSGFAKGHEERICTALQGLTGEANGNELRPWVLWWNRAKLGYRFPEEMPRAPARWASLWAEPDPDHLFDHPAPERDAQGQDGRRGRGRGGDGQGNGGGV